MDSDQSLLERIVSDPRVLTGKPVIRGTRISVELILKLLAQGWTYDEIMDDYPHVKSDDIRACLEFASQSLANTSFMPLSPES
jgi:uncharacterized protein (DUF433 family)